MQGSAFCIFSIRYNSAFVKPSLFLHTEINFRHLTRSKSLHPLGGRWRVAPDEGYLR